MENPLRSLRREAGWTQSELAEFAGITRHAVLRTEQGVYALPPPAILSAISQRLPQASVPYLEQQYKAWVTQKRQEFGEKISAKHPLPVRTGITGPEFLNWRINFLGITSRMRFCRVLCVHPAVVEKFEKGRQKTMPDQLIIALHESGLLLT